MEGVRIVMKPEEGLGNGDEGGRVVRGGYLYMQETFYGLQCNVFPTKWRETVENRSKKIYGVRQVESL